jgi:hypothetical protein
MKKFTFKGVLDGFRSSQPQPPRVDQEIIETLRVDHFAVAKASIPAFYTIYTHTAAAPCGPPPTRRPTLYLLQNTFGSSGVRPFDFPGQPNRPKGSADAVDQ